MARVARSGDGAAQQTLIVERAASLVSVNVAPSSIRQLQLPQHLHRRQRSREGGRRESGEDGRTKRIHESKSREICGSGT